MALTYLNAISGVLDRSFHDNVSQTTCHEPLVDDALFYQLSLIPSVLILVTFGFTQTRRQVMLHVLKARPGLIYPLDVTSKRHRLSYACAFGSTVYLIFQCVLNNFRIIEYDGAFALETFILVVSVFVFGMVHFPVFACLTVGSAYGYGLGALYTWMLTIVSIVRLFSCDVSALTRLLIIVRNGPYLTCLLYLCVTIPGRFYGALQKRRLFVHGREGALYAKGLDAIRLSNQGVHVRNLLKGPSQETEESTKFTRFVNFLMDHTYRIQPGFQYSARLLSTLLVAFILLYAISYESLTPLIIYTAHISDYIKEEPDRSNAETMETVLAYISGILLCSFSIAIILGFYGVMRLFIGYRETMYRMYRGDLDESMRRPAYASHLAGAMKYSGFQVIYVFWGFVIHVIISVIICSILAGIIAALTSGYYEWLTNGVLQLWPLAAWTLGVELLQRFVARYTFLQNPEDSMDITNRRAFFLLTYFTFFYNIFLGIVSCLMRIVKAVAIGALIMPRLDQSNLPTLYDEYDPGYVAYVGFMKLECAQTHPVMIVFLRLLMTSAEERRIAGSKCPDTLDGEKNDWPTPRTRPLRRREVHERPLDKERAAVFNWQILYTLINNPDLRMLRKGYLQKVKLAKQLGLRLPKSDTTYTDIDKVLAEVQDSESEKRLLSKVSRVAESTFEAILYNMRDRKRKKDDIDDDDGEEEEEDEKEEEEEDDNDDNKGDEADDGDDVRIMNENLKRSSRHLSGAAHENMTMLSMEMNERGGDDIRMNERRSYSRHLSDAPHKSMTIVPMEKDKHGGTLV